MQWSRQDGNRKEVCPTWGGGSVLFISTQRGAEKVLTSDLLHGSCPYASSTYGPSQHLLRAPFVAETVINIFLSLLKTQQQWTIIPTFQMRKLKTQQVTCIKSHLWKLSKSGSKSKPSPDPGTSQMTPYSLFTGTSSIALDEGGTTRGHIYNFLSLCQLNVPVVGHSAGGVPIPSLSRNPFSIK